MWRCSQRGRTCGEEDRESTKNELGGAVSNIKFCSPTKRFGPFPSSISYCYSSHQGTAFGSLTPNCGNPTQDLIPKGTMS